MDSFRWNILDGSKGLKLKQLNNRFIYFLFFYKQLHEMLITAVIVMFLSDVWTLILTAPIHCSGIFGEQVM